MTAHNKHIIKHPHLYISSLVKDKNHPYILFVHGGPGLNCGALEYLIEKEGIKARDLIEISVTYQAPYEVLAT